MPTAKKLLVGVAEVRQVELGQPVVGEAQRHGNGIEEVCVEAGVAVVDADGADDLCRLVGKDVARGVDGVRTHVEDRTGKVAMLGAVIGGVDHLGERGGEQMHVAEFARTDFRDGVEGCRLKVQPVGHHELGGAGFGRGQDFIALFGVDLHRLFREHVDAGLECGTMNSA